MNLTYLTLKRPLTIVMALTAIVLLGMAAYVHLPVRRFPEISFPAVQVIVTDPGASPNTVMDSISNPMENQLATISGVYSMTATSFTGKSRVVIEFAQGTNLTQDTQAVNTALQTIARYLPAGASLPSLVPANPSALPILNVAVIGRNATLTSNWVNTTLVPRLQEVPGVGQVTTSGVTVSELQIAVHPATLSALGIPVLEIANQIQTANQSGAAGTLTTTNQQKNVIANGALSNANAFRQLPITIPSSKKTTAPTLLPLGDLATISLQPAPLTTMSNLNGRSALGLSITEQSGANTITVTHNLLDAISRMKSELPTGTHIVATSNTATFTQQALGATQVDLFIAVFLAGLVLFLFLHRWRHTLIVLIAIPTSLIATFGVMWALGFSLDIISLMALSLLIGFLVDDAIVVLENIHRHLDLGDLPWDAAYRGRMEIGGAAVAITLTDVVVYLPLALVGGNVGAMFREFGLTIVSATLFSLLISFTLTPLLASRWLHQPREEAPWAKKWNRGLERLQFFYSEVLAWLLDHRSVAVITLLTTVVATTLFFPLGWIQTSFIPPEDSGLFTVNIQMPPGTRLRTTNTDISRLAQQIHALPGVLSAFGQAGVGNQAYSGTLDVQLTGISHRPSIFTIEAEAQNLVNRIPDMTATMVTANPLTPGNKPPITVHVIGPNMNRVQQLTTAVVARVAALPELTQVSNQSPVSLPEMRLEISHAKAAQLGVSVPNIINTVRTTVQGLTVSTYQPANTASPQENVVVQMAGAVTPTRILSLEVPSSTMGSVALSAVAHVVPRTTATSIQQQNRLYVDTVTAGLHGQALGPAVNAIKKAIAAIHVAPGYQVIYGGQVNQQKTAFGPLFAALGFSVVLVYMLMTALYESLVLPLSIMLTVPLSSIGALTSLALTGQTLNIFSIVGLIMLMGIVTKNAILLVDYTQTLRKRGYDRTSALIEAGKVRLRPIFMTTATMVMAMAPLTLNIGAGAADHQPMAIAVIGGLLSSTLLTLGVVPVFYTLVDDWMPWAMNTKVPEGAMQAPGPLTKTR